MTDKSNDPQLGAALRALETTANSFALRLAKMTEVRVAYVEQIHAMSDGIRDAVRAGELSPAKGAEIANQMRNQIMEMQRLRDFDLGRSLARAKKAQGLSLDDAIARAMKRLGFEGRALESLSGEQQRQLFLHVIDRAGASDAKVTRGIPRLRWASRGLWLATLAMAGYNIGTSEHPWWQSGREAASIAGGGAGGFAGGAAMGALGGVWAGPPGVVVGIVVGGVLGALMADHAYTQAAGTADPLTRAFVGRFTSFWTGVDEEGMARALVVEHRANLAFVERALRSLEHSYSSDADDVAVLYLRLVRSDAALSRALAGQPALRELLIELLSGGYTGADEAAAISWLRTL